MHRVSGGDPLLFEARENVLGAYQQLRDTHPAFPKVLRDFQVIKSTTTPTACTLLPLQADIVAAAINAEDGHHILSSLPTGMGKTLPMIVASCLLPPGELSLFSMKRNESCLSMPRRNLLSLILWHYHKQWISGSFVMQIFGNRNLYLANIDFCIVVCWIMQIYQWEQYWANRNSTLPIGAKIDQ